MTTYTIGEAAKRANMTTHTLRYYDKEGILPFVERDAAGNRIFNEKDISWLETINCLKKTGMPVRQLRKFIELCMKGDSSIAERLAIVKAHQHTVAQKVAEIQACQQHIDYKVWYYETAAQAGTTSIHQKKSPS